MRPIIERKKAVKEKIYIYKNQPPTPSRIFAKFSIILFGSKYLIKWYCWIGVYDFWIIINICHETCDYGSF